MNDPGSSRQVALPQLSAGAAAGTITNQLSDGYEGSSFDPASQAQIIRAHQRDTSQIHHLTELASEIVRSIAGTRWLAHKQTIIDLAIRAAYLVLTLGRGGQTLGEEYTDILPLHARGRKVPGKARRTFTILFLLFPSIITSSSSIAYLRRNQNTAQPHHRPSLDVNPNGQWLSQWKERLANFIESPLGQSLPELHMVFFLYSGRFFEFGRRLTGLSYVSTQPSQPGSKHKSFEPLALLLAVPLIFRLLPRRAIYPDLSESLEEGATARPNSVSKALSYSPESGPLPLLPGEAEQTLLLSKSTSYDTPNTYLTPDAQALPERQCTLCLEPRGTGEGSGGTVGVTECGHVFCWGCLGGLEKLECPLCRQSLRMERLIAAYNL